VLYAKEHGSVGNRKYQQLTGVKERMAPMELGNLLEKGILVGIGKT
jgi:ATP-dependent DNA helicase RecG